MNYLRVRAALIVAELRGSSARASARCAPLLWPRSRLASQRSAGACPRRSSARTTPHSGQRPDSGARRPSRWTAGARYGARYDDGAVRHLSGVRTGRGVAQPGSAPALGAGGRWFESSRPDHFPQKSSETGRKQALRAQHCARCLLPTIARAGRGSYGRTAPLGARPGALVTGEGSATSGAAPAGSVGWQPARAAQHPCQRPRPHLFRLEGWRRGGGGDRGLPLVSCP
jgi:hypothetical protein